MANGIKIGSLTFTQGYIGNTPLIAVYQGSNLIWPIPTPTPSPTPTPTPTPTPAPTYRRYLLGNAAEGIPSSTSISFSYINTGGSIRTGTLNTSNSAYTSINAQSGSINVIGGDASRFQIFDLGPWPADANTTKRIYNIVGGNLRTVSYTNCSGLVDSFSLNGGQNTLICFRNGITLPWGLYILS